MLPDARLRVLCVDDDEDSRVMLTALLRLELIDAKAVGTGAQALSSIQAESFDLYMLDSRLPDVDGFELCRRLRAIDRNTPILFFSGAAFEADKKKGLEAGANAYVIKPDLDGMVSSIRQLAPQPEILMASIIPFKQKTSRSSPFTLPFTFDPAAA
jgi:DNA-binding response OmpR family regulator